MTWKRPRCLEISLCYLIWLWYVKSCRAISKFNTMESYKISKIHLLINTKLTWKRRKCLKISLYYLIWLWYIKGCKITSKFNRTVPNEYLIHYFLITEMHRVFGIYSIFGLFGHIAEYSNVPNIKLFDLPNIRLRWIWNYLAS